MRGESLEAPASPKEKKRKKKKKKEKKKGCRVRPKTKIQRRPHLFHRRRRHGETNGSQDAELLQLADNVLAKLERAQRGRMGPNLLHQHALLVRIGQIDHLLHHIVRVPVGGKEKKKKAYYFSPVFFSTSLFLLVADHDLQGNGRHQRLADAVL